MLIHAVQITVSHLSKCYENGLKLFYAGSAYLRRACQWQVYRRVVSLNILTQSGSVVPQTLYYTEWNYLSPIVHGE